MNPYQAISTIMTKKPVCVLEDDSCQKVQAIFSEKSIHHIPVLNLNDEIVGIISREDMAKLIQSKGAELDSLEVQTIMTAHPGTLSPEDTIGFAADIFLVNKYHALPIIDDDNRLVGIVTSHDLLKYAFNKIPITETDND